VNTAESGVRGETADRAADSGRADRHRLIARIAGDIGHELKNPIHASVINLELVRKRIAEGGREDALDRLDIVSDQVRRVHGVVEGLLKLLRESREPEGERELDRVVETVLPLLRAQANAAGVELEWVPAGPGTLCGVSTECLGHTLVGLVSQALAVARTGPNGFVRVEATSEPCAVRVGASGGRPSTPPQPLEPWFAETVARIAASDGMAIAEDPVGSGVSWSRVVLLDGRADA
jgi:signal transduction histidine kinase